ncbi:7776_t:CDS:10 [Ambispora gerdemannii]|uniref:7776_t:CDS:1 n=1 Tax=Ambispora gerdemannii TaxID=144530 RepID=A0A9N8V0P6_9GLOM|nr:7776_t:CDS:10 [Ambispora gerdemannii]
MNDFDFFDSPPPGLVTPVLSAINMPRAKPSLPLDSSPQVKSSLPPDLLLRIIKYLPITSLPNFARVCRRFKVLVSDDEIWEHHLRKLGFSINSNIDNSNGLPIKTSKNNKSSIDSSVSNSTTMEITKTLSNSAARHLFEFGLLSGKSLSLMPGLYDLFAQKSRSSTGITRSIFKEIYSELLPYYLDFRHKRKDSKLYKDFADPLDQAKMLRRLTIFGNYNITSDSSKINSVLETTVEYCENMALHNFELGYNASNYSEMKKWATLLLELNEGVSCIQVFIQKNSIFFDHLYDPLDNFLHVPTSGELNYAPMAEFFKSVEDEFIKQASVIDQVFPQSANVFYTFVERVIEDVVTEYVYILSEEAHNRDKMVYFKTTVAAHQFCQHTALVLWKEAKPGLDKIKAEDLMYQMFEPMMERYLNEELDEIRVICEEEIDKWNKKLVNEKAEAQQQALLNNGNHEIYKRNYLSSFRKILKLSTSRSRNPNTTPPSRASPHDKRSSTASVQSSLNSPQSPISASELQEALLWNARLEKLQKILSVETALQLVHANKDALRRVGTFVGYPDRMGVKVQETLESIFITLLQTLGPMHIKPGFDTAVLRLGEYKPDAESTSQGLAPLVEFFELVHIADLIQQMLQVYYDEEMCRFIDKDDFLNECNEEKKKFEKLLDESVAAGLNKGIQVLTDQVEFILATEQKPEEFMPKDNANLDLKPTKACINAVDCLSSHAKLVVGCSDKNTLDVFFQEIGLRVFGILTKHLKKFVVNILGGFQVISDLNHYCAFLTSLKQNEITSYIIALKELGNIYIISSAKDIGLFVREADRFNGVLRAEDVYEFCLKREDWLSVKKEVEKQLFGLRAEDCIIM